MTEEVRQELKQGRGGVLLVDLPSGSPAAAFLRPPGPHVWEWWLGPPTSVGNQENIHSCAHRPI